MRRILAVLLGVLVLAGVVVAPTYAAAPAPKVTIEGFIDNTTALSNNASVTDLDITRNTDDEWYSRTRVNLIFTGEVGKSRLVTFMQLDNNWGSQQGGCYGTPLGAGHFGTRDGCLNTEYVADIEMVWAFAEFPFMGKGSLLPFIPVPSQARVGFQPFDNDTYKLAVLANGNFGGVHLDIDPFPGFRITATYAQIDESGIGLPFVTSNASPGNSCTGPGTTGCVNRGDDWAGLVSVEFTPIKGFDLKPLYAYTYIANTSNPANPFAYGPRTGKGGVADSVTFFPQGTNEYRSTIGLDVRWKWGGFYLDPTVMYQWGTRQMNPSNGTVVGIPVAGKSPGHGCPTCIEQSMNAWFVDIRGGWQAGPLTLDGLAMFTTGNKAEEDVRSGAALRYFQPIDTNAGYAFDWGMITAITYEYITQLYYGQTGICPSCSIGYDKYGRFQLAARLKYQLTPDFQIRALATGLWTHQEVDTRSNVSTNPGGGGGALNAIRVGGGSQGSERYLGTEVNVGFEWAFAPNFRLLGGYGHLFAGSALDIAGSSATVVGTTARDAKDVDLGSLTLRFTF